MKHKLFLFLAVIGMMLPQTIFAYDFKVGRIYYNKSGSNATVTYGDQIPDSYSSHVTIPATVTYGGVTYNVTSIGNYAFQNCSGLTSVTIPNSVTSIGESAFSGCSGLTSVTIPNSVTSIEHRVFYACTGLTSVTIPNSVVSIGDYAFFWCRSLTSITIPNSVTSIGECAFRDCSGLTSINIPGSVTSIGNYAFQGCRGLTSMTIMSGNTKYDSRENCNAIIETSTNTLVAGCKNTIIPNSVTSIGNMPSMVAEA